MSGISTQYSYTVQQIAPKSQPQYGYPPPASAAVAAATALSSEIGDCLGIDFGNSNICVGYYKNQQFQVFELESKTRHMPAWITLKENDYFIGDAAKNTEKQKTTKAVLYDFRRVLSSEKVEFEDLPFEVEGQTFNPKTQPFPVFRALALIFLNIRKKIEAELNQAMRNVVITVPSGFNLSQRQIMVSAAELVGFSVLHVLNEPVAAAISYYAAKLEDKKTICIVDLGGGKLDVANVQVDKGRIELLNSACDLKLGGRDFDECLFAYVRREIKNKYPDVKIHPKYYSIIRKECIKAKESLTSSPTANINIVLPDDDIFLVLSQQTFEAECSLLFSRVSEMVSNVLKHAQASEILLIGGATRMPKIQHDLQKLCHSINKTINQEEAVAKGAAVYATMLSKLIKPFEVIERVPWNNIKPVNAQMEYYIENGKVLVQIYDATESSMDPLILQQEKDKIRELLMMKESTNKKIDDLDKCSRNIQDATQLLDRSTHSKYQNFKLETLQQQLKEFISYFSQSPEESNVYTFQGLNIAMFRLKTCLDSADFLDKWSHKDFKKASEGLDKAVKRLCETAAMLGQAIVQNHYEYIFALDKWMQLDYKIKISKKQKLSKQSEKLLNQLIKVCNDLAGSLNSFEERRYPISFNYGALDKLLVDFDTSLTLQEKPLFSF